MTSWQKCWREGFQPQLSTEGLLALALALASNDVRIIQGGTTSPPPLWCCIDEECMGGDPIAYIGMASGLKTVREVEEFWVEKCFECDKALGEVAGNRYLNNWWDENPRDTVRRCLHAEIVRELAKREELSPVAV